MTKHLTDYSIEELENAINTLKSQQEESPEPEIRLATQEEILEQVEAQNFTWFDPDYGDCYIIGNEFGESYDHDFSSLVEEVEYENGGDGRDVQRTLYFKPYDLYVTLRGTYSSYSGTEWENIFVSEPYIKQIKTFRPLGSGETQ